VINSSIANLKNNLNVNPKNKSETEFKKKTGKNRSSSRSPKGKKIADFERMFDNSNHNYSKNPSSSLAAIKNFNFISKLNQGSKHQLKTSKDNSFKEKEILAKDLKELNIARVDVKDNFELGKTPSSSKIPIGNYIQIPKGSGISSPSKQNIQDKDKLKSGLAKPNDSISISAVTYNNEANLNSSELDIMENVLNLEGVKRGSSKNAEMANSLSKKEINPQHLLMQAHSTQRLEQVENHRNINDGKGHHTKNLSSGDGEGDRCNLERKSSDIII
jgi:hypothetical protein